MSEPDSNSGVFRWAWNRTQGFLGTLVGGVVLVSVALAVGAAVLVPPSHAGTIGRLAYGLAGLAAGLVGLLALAYGVALAVAPFQQRNTLRGEVKVLRARVAVLETSPVDLQHANHLRLIAGQLRETVEKGGIPAYGLPAGIDEDIWRTVFLQHFPALRPGLEIAERKGSAVKTFEARLEREARLDGMVNPPWTPEIFIPS